MGQTVIPIGSKLAQKKWSGKLFIDTLQKSYWNQRFVSTDDNAPIQRLTDLESAAGDTIQYDLSIQLRGRPVYGDNVAEGTEEDLKFASDEVKIDQMRHPVSLGGRMTRKRTDHDLRVIGKARLSDYWAKFMDDMFFMYLSGARGVNEDFIEGPAYAGFAGNAFTAPDNDHLLYPAGITSKAAITTSDTMSRELVERAAVKARMMRAKDPTTANMQPIRIDGGDHYVMVMSPFQEHDLRNEVGERGWLDVQKAAAAAEGRNNPIFKGGMGMINNVVLHSHESAVRFNDYGAGNNVAAARALFMGRQAAVIAFGSQGGLRFTWQEKKADYDNLVTINAGTIMGMKKTRFNGKDFGVLTIDTAAKDPNVVANG